MEEEEEEAEEKAKRSQDVLLRCLDRQSRKEMLLLGECSEHVSNVHLLMGTCKADVKVSNPSCSAPTRFVWREAWFRFVLRLISILSLLLRWSAGLYLRYVAIVRWRRYGLILDDISCMGLLISIQDSFKNLHVQRSVSTNRKIERRR